MIEVLPIIPYFCNRHQRKYLVALWKTEFIVQKFIYIFPFLIAALLLMSISSYAQQIIAKQMPFLEQLPSNEVIDLHQDQNGFIWLGTKNGLG
ncbi:MAG: hypothetical protein LUH50_26065 [Bacteroides intestinalis]|nr:hypothetical protein [Bacteroides intestinalis]